MYGPTAVNALGDFVKWVHSPPKLDEVGQKISDMIDDKDNWEIINDSHFQYYKDNVKKFQVLVSKSSGTIYFRTAYDKDITDRLNSAELRYLKNKFDSLTASLKIKKWQKENTSILRDLE